MAVSKRTLSGIIIQLAVSLFLIVSGIITVQLDSGIFGALQAGFSGNELASAVYNLFGHTDIAGILVIVLGICELIAGAFLLLNFFISTGKVTNLFILIILIVWICVIVLVDVFGNGGMFGGAFNSLGACLSFLKSFSSHLLVLGGLLLVWKK